VWKADLEEVADELDSDAHAYAESTGAWHGLSRDGEAVGRLIYANYGRKRDYDQLVQKGQVPFPTMAIPRELIPIPGVNFTGAIVIVRYGGVFRGLKVNRLRAYYDTISLAHRSKGRRSLGRLVSLFILTHGMTALLQSRTAMPRKTCSRCIVLTQ
jgi:hypothetical protein